MPIGIYEKNDIDAIAETIRSCMGGGNPMTTAEMPEAIRDVKERGFSMGYTDGNIYGLSQGREQGHAEGLEEGKAIGYVEGKTDGIAEGRQAQYDEFWDTIIAEGIRKDCPYLFAYWPSKYIRPNNKLAIKGGAGNIFYRCPNLLSVEKEFFDFSTATTFTYACSECPKLEIFEDVGLGVVPSLTYAWFYCTKLITIEVVRCNEATTFNRTFDRCDSLENLIIEGIIGQNGFNVQWCPLTHDSLMSIINALKDNSGTDTWKVINLGSENIAKLTEQEIEIMANKQWEYG